jgi:hypothetical protein
MSTVVNIQQGQKLPKGKGYRITTPLGHRTFKAVLRRKWGGGQFDNYEAAFTLKLRNRKLVPGQGYRVTTPFGNRAFKAVLLRKFGVKGVTVAIVEIPR